MAQLAPQRATTQKSNKKGKSRRVHTLTRERTQRAFVRACTEKLPRAFGDDSTIANPLAGPFDRHRRGSPKKPQNPDKTTKEKTL